jgi:two-component system response regulator PilR (NtrC family)
LDIESTLAVLEKSLLIQALRRTGGVKTPAAELLGLSLRTFRYRLQKYQLDDNEGDGEVV